MTLHSESSSTQASGNQRMLWIMALACGLCAGSNYFNQPLLHSMAQHFGVNDAHAALSVTVAQVAYGIGLLLIVPLGDIWERRRLIASLVAAAALGLLICAVAPSMTWLFIGTAMTGLFSVAAQVLVPLAAAMVAPQMAGRVVGMMMGGLFVGILLARSVAGVISSLHGWQTVYWVGGALMLMMSVVLWRSLPTMRSQQTVGYAQTMRSLLHLVRVYPRLRWRTAMGALSFGGASVLYTTMALFLAGPEFGLSDMSIGLIGLVGVAAVWATAWAGKWSDKGKDAPLTAFCIAMYAAAWLALWFTPAGLWWFALGFLLTSLCVPAVQVANQSVIYALQPDARSRINAVYMTGYFAGGAIGSAIGAWAWSYAGWLGVCIAGALIGVLQIGARAMDGLHRNRHSRAV